MKQFEVVCVRNVMPFSESGRYSSNHPIKDEIYTVYDVALCRKGYAYFLEGVDTTDEGTVTCWYAHNFVLLDDYLKMVNVDECNKILV